MMDMSHDVSIAGMFLLGLLGTGHCIGMCGPLVVAFPGRSRRFVPHCFYHAGRIATYALVGVAMSLVGLAIGHVAAATGSDPAARLAQVQVVFSLIAAALLVLLGLVRLGVVREPTWLSAVSLGRFFKGSPKEKNRAVVTSSATMFTTGAMMGFLPCGMSYAVFAMALSTMNPLEAFALVLAFGVGTLPGLLLVGRVAVQLARKYRRQSDLISGVIMIAMAVWLVVKAWPG